MVFSRRKIKRTDGLEAIPQHNTIWPFLHILPVTPFFLLSMYMNP